MEAGEFTGFREDLLVVEMIPVFRFARFWYFTNGNIYPLQLLEMSVHLRPSNDEEPIAKGSD